MTMLAQEYRERVAKPQRIYGMPVSDILEGDVFVRSGLHVDKVRTPTETCVWLEVSGGKGDPVVLVLRKPNTLDILRVAAAPDRTAIAEGQPNR